MGAVSLTTSTCVKLHVIVCVCVCVCVCVYRVPMLGLNAFLNLPTDTVPYKGTKGDSKLEPIPCTVHLSLPL